MLSFCFRKFLLQVQLHKDNDQVGEYAATEPGQDCKGWGGHRDAPGSSGGLLEDGYEANPFERAASSREETSSQQEYYPTGWCQRRMVRRNVLAAVDF